MTSEHVCEDTLHSNQGWRIAFWVVLLSLCVLGWGQANEAPKAPAPPADAAEKARQKQQQLDDHKPSIASLEIGMTAQQVLDRLGRMPDARKDEKGEIILSWKLKTGDILQVHFRGENVSYLGLEYRPPRPTNDFNLQPLGESLAADPRTRIHPRIDTTGTPAPMTVGSVPIGGSEDKAPVMGHNLDPNAITGRDPRLHPEYKVAETNDRERTVWNRREKDPRGFRLEIGFISTDRKKRGSQYEGQVQFKYVSVEREDLKKFDQVMAAAK